MAFAYIVYFIVFVFFIRIFVRIFADHVEYYRNKPKIIKNTKGKAQPFTNNKITVIRRESSGLTSFAVWDFFLNGENIGRIKDGESETFTTKKRKNLLEAKDSHGAQSPPFKFFVENGSESQVTFNKGRFGNPQGMNIVLPSDEGIKRIAAALKTKRWAWVYWAFIIGYYAVIFIFLREQIALVLLLPFLPVTLISIIGWFAYRDLVDYLSYNHPEAWGRISRELYRLHFIKSLIFFDDEIDDFDYLELKIQYEKILGAQLFCASVFLATHLYILSNAVNH